MFNLHLIKELCEKKNIKLKDLASQIGMSSEGLSNILKTNSTKMSTLQKIASVLGVTPDYFMSEPDSGIRFRIREPEADYGIKDKYIKTLEDNARLAKELADAKEKLAWYDANCDCDKQNKAG